MTFIKLNFFTKEARDIVEAAFFHWKYCKTSCHKNWFMQIDKIEFNDCIAPAGELCLTSTPTGQTDISAVANAIKEMFRICNCSLVYYQPTECQELSVGNMITEDNEIIMMKRMKESIDFFDKTNDRDVYVRKFKYDNTGHRLWFEYNFVKINIKAAWIMYDLILNHRQSTLEKIYGIESIDKIVGKPRNPMELEQAKTRGEEITKINQKLQSEIIKITQDYNSRIDSLRNEQKAKIEKLQEAAKAKLMKLDEDIAKMKEPFTDKG